MIKRAFQKLSAQIENMNLTGQLAIMTGMIFIPFLFLSVFLLVMLGGVGESYDSIAQNVTRANVYNIHFKEDMDSVMYQMIARSLGKNEVGPVVSMTNLPHMLFPPFRYSVALHCEFPLPMRKLMSIIAQSVSKTQA